MLFRSGIPVRCNNKLYNCAAVIHKGVILGLVPKLHIPSYGEFYESRWFTSGTDLSETDFSIPFAGQESVDFSPAQVFRCAALPELVIGVEICEDLWVSEPPSARLAAEGATLILNLSASDEVVGKADYRRSLVAGQSGRLVCGYLYADAGEGESSTDLVFAGHCLIAENGAILAERRFACGLTVSEIDGCPPSHPRAWASIPTTLTWPSPTRCSPAASPPPPLSPRRPRGGRSGAARSCILPPWG